MTLEEVNATVRDMLIMALVFVTPFLAVATITSFLVGVLQASTRVNDLTLSFVPRLVAVLLLAYLAGGWIVSEAMGFVERSVIAARSLGG